MAAERLTITPSVITWARKRAGLSLEEAKNFGRIEEWENGVSSPTYPQLEALATALKVPVAVFFFPDPPDLPDIGKSFRTLPAAEFEAIPSRVQLLVRKAKAFQLLHNGGPPRKSATPDQDSRASITTAEHELSLLEFGESML